MPTCWSFLSAAGLSISKRLRRYTEEAEKHQRKQNAQNAKPVQPQPLISHALQQNVYTPSMFSPVGSSGPVIPSIGAGVGNVPYVLYDAPRPPLVPDVMNGYSWVYPQTSLYPAYPAYPAPPEPPTHNTTEMTREMLLQVLDRFSEVLATTEFFGTNEVPSTSSSPRIRLIVHGGACMLLHPQLYALSMYMPLSVDSVFVPESLHMSGLPRRTTTRDVDVLLRAFIVDYGEHKYDLPISTKRHSSSWAGSSTSRSFDPSDLGKVAQAMKDSVDVNPAAVKLREAVKKTAQWFSTGWGMRMLLGADWMNADADVSLPLGIDPTTKLPFDPVHVSSLSPQNLSWYTVYTSPNRFLELVSVPPYWSVSLKLARWDWRDWGDVGILLRHEALLFDTQWTSAMLRQWVETNCWPMGYKDWKKTKRMEMNERIRQAVGLIDGWEVGVAASGSGSRHLG